MDGWPSPNLILEALNKLRFEAKWRSSDEKCRSDLVWDSDLAEAAQVWADQCAMVEYKEATASMVLSIILNDLFINGPMVPIKISSAVHYLTIVMTTR